MTWYSPPVLALMLVVASSAPVAMAQDEATAAQPAPVAKSVDSSAPCLPRDDEIWLISTRHLCYANWEDPSSYELDVRRYNRESDEWLDASTGEFFNQPALPTVMYVHGNRVNWWQASQYGWRVYYSLAASDGAPAKMRYVIWTWPSDEIHGQLKDVRAKAVRADQETFFLGWFLAQCRQGESPSLIGYSYGARIVTGAMHLLAGGDFHGRSLPKPVPAHCSRYRVALLAAALDCDWLSPGHWHGEALQRTERMLVLFNTCDPALKHYDRLDRCTNSALGFLGTCGYLGEEADRVEEFNVAPVVGRSHDEERYFASSSLRAEMGRVLFAPLSTPNDAR